MTDHPDERRDDDRPPAGPSPAADPDGPAADDPAGTTPTGGGSPSPGGSPPAGTPPPAPAAPGPSPQAQWPQQQPGSTTGGMTGSEQRNWAVGAHVGALAASVLTGLAVLGPLLVYLIKKDEDTFVREHSREALNFQLTWLIGGIVATVLGVIISILTIGFALIVLVPAGIGFAIAWIVFMVKAAMAASRGEYYRYPLTVRMVT